MMSTPSLTALLIGLERFEQFSPQLRNKGIQLLANEHGISSAQLWHIHSLWAGGAS